jgi:hypothetical protein
MGRSALMVGHLEDVSRRVLDEYPGIVRGLIGGRHGVYALYHRGKLRYVGLASGLFGRLKAHRRDRHSKSWDRFSVYLTVRSDHTRELESLLLRIVTPRDNRTRGAFSGSTNLFRTLHHRVRDHDADQRALILGGSVALRRRRLKARRERGQDALAGFSDRQIKLVAKYKGKRHRATLKRDGTIRLTGKLYESPSAAARAITKRRVNGWHFWHYKSGTAWKRLRTIRGR